MTNIIQASSPSAKWQITVSKSLQNIEAFKEYPIAEPVELFQVEPPQSDYKMVELDFFTKPVEPPQSDYEMVGWDQFEIHSIDQKKLYTTQLGPCLGLSARVYDIAGKLTHIGIAHKFVDDNLPQAFLESLREKVKGRIELFIAGGDNRSDELLGRIRSLVNEKNNVKIVDDVSKKFFKNFTLTLRNTVYFGFSGINQIYFDREFNSRLQVDLNVGLSNSELLELSDPVLKERPAVPAEYFPIARCIGL